MRASIFSCTHKTNTDKEFRLLVGKLVIFIIMDNYKALKIPNELSICYSGKSLSRALQQIHTTTCNILLRIKVKELYVSLRKGV